MELISSAVDEKELLSLIEGAVTETNNGRKEIISVEDFEEEECVEINRCVKRKVGADEESAIIVSDDEEEASSSLGKGKMVQSLEEEEEDVVALYEIINIRDDRDKISAYMQGLGRPCDGQPAFYRRGKPDWSTLPAELLVYMFQFVHPRILIERLSKVCDRWRGVVRYIVHCKATNYFWYLVCGLSLRRGPFKGHFPFPFKGGRNEGQEEDAVQYKDVYFARLRQKADSQRKGISTAERINKTMEALARKRKKFAK